MAIRFIDGFNNNSVAQLAEKWGHLSNSGSVSLATTNPRFTGSRYLNLAQPSRYLEKTFDSQATWVVGFAFRREAPGTSSNGLISLMDAATTQLQLLVNIDGTLSVGRSTSPTTTLGTSTNFISLSTWYFIEFKATINDTTGSFEVRVNGSNWLSATGQDTQVSGIAGANKIRFGVVNGTFSFSPLHSFDDFYALDSTGTTNNDFLGDVRVQTIIPTGNGNSNQWIGSDGNSIDNYLLVDENPADGDTTYVESGNINDIDLYQFEDLPATSTTIYAMQPCLYSRKTDAGSRVIMPAARTNGTNYDIGSNLILSGAYLWNCAISELNPDTGLAWTNSEVNAAEFGVKVAS